MVGGSFSSKKKEIEENQSRKSNQREKLTIRQTLEVIQEAFSFAIRLRFLVD